MRKFFLIFNFLYFSQICFAGNVIELDEIHLFESFGIFEKLGFSNVEVITKEDIEINKHRVINDLIEEAKGVDLVTRGNFGIQDDLSIRGMGFEENLVMIDGISLNDPQTGHFNLDLPLSIYDLEKVEIMRGAGSSIYGSNAMGGVLNFITPSPEADSLKLRTIYGAKQLNLQNISLDRRNPFLNFHISYEIGSSASYRPETEFKKENFFSKFNFNEIIGSPSLIVALNKKDFGASTFYSSNYTQQEEHTKLNLYILSLNFSTDNFKVSPKFYYRRHWDKYFLDRSRYDWYKNIHRNYITGLKVPLDFKLGVFKINLGFEGVKEDIKSSSLDKHSRNRISFFSNIASPTDEKLFFNFSIRLDDYDKYQTQLSPGLYLGYKINEKDNVFLSLQKGYRVPSFTELYYLSPANIGNSNLNVEDSVNIETGFKRKDEMCEYGVSVFKIYSYNMIDWAKNVSSDAWVAENISYISSSGIEAWCGFENFKFSYSFLDSDYKSDAVFNKYVANYIEHKFNLSREFKFKKFDFNITSSYQEKSKRSGFFNVDLHLKRDVKSKDALFTFFLGVNNLTNSNQVDIQGVALPGRWIYAGLGTEF